VKVLDFGLAKTTEPASRRRLRWPTNGECSRSFRENTKENAK
jgi:hypothetical protein